MQTLKTIAVAIMLATLASVAVDAQTASRNVAYHSQDIVATVFDSGTEPVLEGQIPSSSPQ